MKNPLSLALFTIAIIFTACQPLTNTPRSLGGSNGAGDDIEPILTKYNGTKSSVKYTLVVTHIPARTVVKGDDYELTTESGNAKKTSTGTIEAVDGNNLTLKPGYENAKSFTMGFDGTTIIKIDGTITFNDGTTQTGPGAFVSSAEGDNNNGDDNKTGDNKESDNKGSDSRSPTVTSVTISPSTATVINNGGTQQFSATVNGTNNPSQTVTWSLMGAASLSSISSSGLLTVDQHQAPGVNILTVRATSTFDASKYGTAMVTVSSIPPALNPASATVPRGSIQQFYLMIFGGASVASNTTWSVTGGGNGTSISPSGLLTVGANETAAILTVRGTSIVDPTQTATAKVTVTDSGTGTPAVTGVSVNPIYSEVYRGGTKQFSAVVYGTGYPPQTVTWTVSGGVSGTTISQTGLLTISENQPAYAQSLIIKATSTVDNSKIGSATATVFHPAYTVSYNLNGGSGTAPPMQTVNHNSAVIIPDSSGFSRNGYTFVAWNSNTGGEGYNMYPGDTFVPSGADQDKTFYAQWKKVVTSIKVLR